MLIREQSLATEDISLASYATHARDTVGRVRPEEECPIRTPYQRDRDRIIHCNAFRRLMHKTQVFLFPQGDHYRTRLTHTLEVGQIARTIARGLRLNEDLTEAIAMGHDLGHTPFGHAGEAALRECSPIFFVHSEQSVRVVEKLERDGAGLNLTGEVKNGILCHSDKSPWADTPEGRVVRYADKFAYMNHDTEDAIRAGILDESELPWEVRYALGQSRNERLATLIGSVVETSDGADIKLA
ncbi:MAG: HD domain-containing protein, partial [Angelakisella sp.]